ncbi:hypothetical protein BHM03_00047293 [Ensete ventricosum]|nr:hypothetical protein BHM03_00047293 [Ensete ventricosum]
MGMSSMDRGLSRRCWLIPDGGGLSNCHDLRVVRRNYRPKPPKAVCRRRKASRLGRRPSRATTWTPRQRQEATTPPRRLPLPSPLLSSPAHSGPDHAEAAAALPVLLPVDPPRPAAVAAVPHLACDGGPGGQTRRDASRDLIGEAPFRGPLLRLRAEQGHVHHLGPAAAPAAWSPTSTSCLIAWTGPPLIGPSTAPATVVPMAVICRHRRRSSATAPPEIILTSPSRTGPSGAGKTLAFSNSQCHLVYYAARLHEIPL